MQEKLIHSNRSEIEKEKKRLEKKQIRAFHLGSFIFLWPKKNTKKQKHTLKPKTPSNNSVVQLQIFIP